MRAEGSGRGVMQVHVGWLLWRRCIVVCLNNGEVPLMYGHSGEMKMNASD